MAHSCHVLSINGSMPKYTQTHTVVYYLLVPASYWSSLVSDGSSGLALFFSHPHFDKKSVVNTEELMVMVGVRVM